ncbi:MAG: hypothetical protein WKF47_06350 [Geodermatophilaceae bacterium]
MNVHAEIRLLDSFGEFTLRIGDRDDRLRLRQQAEKLARKE